MNKITSVLNIKSLLVFALTVGIGLWFGGFFERYVFHFGFSKSFSEREAKQLIGKQVKDVCFAKPNSERIGEIFGYSKDNFGDVSTQIRWDDTDPKSYATYSKGCFEQCVKLTNPE